MYKHMLALSRIVSQIASITERMLAYSVRVYKHRSRDMDYSDVTRLAAQHLHIGAQQHEPPEPCGPQTLNIARVPIITNPGVLGSHCPPDE